MSEKINFIPANELPVAEGDEVEVLCVESGEMKRKPVKGLGGGGSYVMKPTTEEVSLSGSEFTITANADELIAVIESGGYASVLLPTTFTPGGMLILGPCCWMVEEGVFSMVSYAMGMAMTVVFTNFTALPNWE